MTQQPNIVLAQPGDRGVVIGAEGSRMSGCAYLLLRSERGELLYLVGDWRPIRDLSRALYGEQVEVVECDSSAWGLHAVQVIGGDDE